MNGDREKMVADIISSVLRDVRLSDRYLMSPDQHRARARRLRAWKPDSRAAELHEMAASAIESRPAANSFQVSLAAVRMEGKANVALTEETPTKLISPWREARVMARARVSEAVLRQILADVVVKLLDPNARRIAEK